MNEIVFRAMGSEIYCAVDSGHRRVGERLERVPAMFQAWEKTLSRFRADSELSQLNARTGDSVRINETLWQVLELAERAERWSQGLVTPLVLDALESAGYVQSFETLQTEMSPAGGWHRSYEMRAFSDAPARARVEQSWSMDAASHTVSLAPGARLDLGGVAKGWAAEQTANYLGELGATMVDAGGDMVITAPCHEGMWSVGIENPFDPADDETLPMLKITRGAVATSGRDFRKWTHNGKDAHHLIDPRTGSPAITRVLTATIIAPTIFQAEVAAKVALILGHKEGMQWVDGHPELAALLVLEDGCIKMNPRMETQIV